MTTITEADVEQATLDWQVAHGLDIAPDKPNAGDQRLQADRPQNIGCGLCC